MKVQVGSEDGLRTYVRSVFDQFDVDNSNDIDADEFRLLCIELGYYFSPTEVGAVCPNCCQQQLTYIHPVVDGVLHHRYRSQRND